MTVRAFGSVAVVLALVGAFGDRVEAQDGSDGGGFIGRGKPRLEIDDCPAVDPALTDDQLRTRGSEHYTRGETLYAQGDYEGAVHELVAAYCLKPYYTILKDIGQAYERDLEYEKAIGYLERYIGAVPADAKRATSCAPDPQEDKANVDRRVKVLSEMPAKIYVETTPLDAQITISNDAGIPASRARSRQEISVLGGRYEMLVEREGYVSTSQQIEVRIGRPYTYYVALEPQTGLLSVQVTPADARVFLGDRAVGIGRFEDTLPSGRYKLSFEAPGLVRSEREVEVLAGRTRRELVEMAPEPQSGKRSLLVAATLVGGIAAGSLAGGFSDDAAVPGAAGVLGAAGALVASYLWAPADVPLGATNLSITMSATGAYAALSAAPIVTEDANLTSAMLGGGLVLGAAAGFYAGDRFDVSAGDAALINSAVLWGGVTGSLFAVSFDAPPSTSGGLRLSGIGMGAVGGVLMSRYFDISRRHAVLIDIGGLVGGISGYALRGLIYPRSEEVDDRARRERDANYTLGGIAIGLVAAGILTRNVDVPKAPVRVALDSAPTRDGRAVTTFGLAGTW